MTNGMNQNPCLVSAYLQGACNGGRMFLSYYTSHLQISNVQPEFSVGALPPDTHYTGPYADESNECQCSSVTYNTVSACGLCQNATIIR